MSNGFSSRRLNQPKRKYLLWLLAMVLILNAPFVSRFDLPVRFFKSLLLPGVERFDSPIKISKSPFWFGVVKEGMIYRSAQPSPEFLKRIIKEKKIKTILKLNPPEPKTNFEREIAAKMRVNLIELPMDVRNFLSFQIWQAVEILKDSRNYPILVHCNAGRDRTGLIVAVFRMKQMQWTYEAAFKEMLSYRFKPWKHPRIVRYVANEFEEITERKTMTEEQAKVFTKEELDKIRKVLVRFPKLRAYYKNQLSGF